MDKYNDDELYILELYAYCDKEIKKVYKEQKNNRDELLKEIAGIMLTYTIVNEFMNLDKKQKDTLDIKLFKMVKGFAEKQGKVTVDTINNILNETIKRTFNHYSYNVNLKDVKKIVDSSFEGKHFSSRVWKNEQDVAENLHLKIKEFIDSKISVNDIKNTISDLYNNNAYQVKRLVDTELSRSQNEAFTRFCKETDVKKLKYNARFENTCSICAEDNGKIFDFGEEPSLPRHPQCKCFYEIES